MESLVSTEISTELAQILSNILQGDNELRRQSERLLNERYLATNPSSVLLALLQFSRSGPEHMRSFSLVLLRRLLFRSLPSAPGLAIPKNHNTLYDHLSEATRNTIEVVSLRCMTEEASESVRRKFADTICDLASGSMERGRPWTRLDALMSLTHSPTPGHREVAFRIFGSVPNLVLDESVPEVLAVFERGLKDAESVTVRQSALKASVAYLNGIDFQRRPPETQARVATLMHPMLETLVPPLPRELLPTFLRTLIPLASSSPWFFAPHLSSLLSFLPPLILPPPPHPPNTARPEGRSKTPTTDEPFPPATPTLHFPDGHEEYERDEEADELRVSALELMVSLTEARPSMVKRQDGWVAAMVRGALEGMGEIPERGFAEDPADDDNSQYVEAFEQGLDRLAIALGGNALLPIAFHYIPAMLGSPDWRHRHAGLIAIAALAEGTATVMTQELGKVVALVTPAFHDPHPRVQWAACQCIGTLCDDLTEVIQEQFYPEIISSLLFTLSSPEPRVHAHAAAALINFCEGVVPEVLIPHLDDIVSRLLGMLNAESKRYVQEQALTSLAMVADAASTSFQKYYSTIMPLLLNVLRNGTAFDHRKLRCKAMECAGLIAIAVGTDTFKPDAQDLAEVLMRIQSTPTECDETVESYLVATWAKICQALGPAFEPYLPFIMPSLLRAAAVKADLTILGEAGDEGADAEFEGWETLDMDGQKVGIKTAVLEQKANAYAMLVIHCSTMGSKFAPYLSDTLNLVLPGLRFFFHDGVREACALLIPMLIVCAKQSGNLTSEMVEAIFNQIVLMMKSQTDSGFLASLYKAFADSMLVIGRESVSPDIVDGVIHATQSQLQIMAQKRTRRSEQAVQNEDDREEMLLLEEMENFELEEMRKTLKIFDKDHPLLIAIGSIKELGLGNWDEDEG